MLFGECVCCEEEEEEEVCENLQRDGKRWRDQQSGLEFREFFGNEEIDSKFAGRQATGEGTQCHSADPLNSTTGGSDDSMCR